MTEFRHRICEPLNPHIIGKGSIAKNDIIATFNNFPWDKYLKQMETAKASLIYYSPSLEIENKNNKNGLAISAVGKPNNNTFHVFFKRPKMLIRFFGLFEEMNEHYTSNLTDKTEKDVLFYLEALGENKLWNFRTHV